MGRGEEPGGPTQHSVSFEQAQEAFRDPHMLIIKDIFHSSEEERWFCVGDIGTGIVTVRFTARGNNIRIFGAGYWRRLRRKYLQEKGVGHAPCCAPAVR